MDKEKERDNIMKESLYRAIHCFGTARIIENKLKWLKRIDKMVKFIGLALPVSVGSFVIASGRNATFTQDLLFAVGILSFLQLIVILWSLIDSWNIKQVNYLGAVSKNMYLSNLFREIKIDMVKMRKCIQIYI